MKKKYRATTELLDKKRVNVVKNGKWYIDPNGKRQKSPIGATFDEAKDAHRLADRLNSHS